MTNIVAISGNTAYRIGDCILTNATVEMIALNPNKYKDTFLYKYCIYMKPFLNKARHTPGQRDVSHNYKIQVSARIVAEFIRSRRFKIPAQDTLVIHLRLGDCYTTEGKFPTAKYLIPNKTQTLNDINKFSGKKITIVTAFNNHSNEPYHIKTHNTRSQQFLDDLLHSIPEKYQVSIQSSSNIDADFIYLCAAKYLLLTGKSYFGTVAREIGIILHKIAH